MSCRAFGALITTLSNTPFFLCGSFGTWSASISRKHLYTISVIQCYTIKNTTYFNMPVFKFISRSTFSAITRYTIRPICPFGHLTIQKVRLFDSIIYITINVRLKVQDLLKVNKEYENICSTLVKTFFHFFELLQVY